MAEKKEDLDLDVEAGKSKTNLLIIILIVVILAVGGGVAAMFLLSGDDSKKDKGEHNAGESESHAAPVHAIYSALRPTFIINFEDSSKARYMQLDLSVMAHQQHSIDLVQEHSPVIRNNIITLLSSQKFEEVNTFAGKQKLQKQLLDSINQTIDAEVKNIPAPKDEEGDSNEHGAATSDHGGKYIEAVYFTSFVMQ